MKSETAWPTDNNVTVSLTFEDNFKPFFKMHDSSTYIATLENKLSKLSSSRTQPVGKAMIDVLFMAKDDHMSRHLNEGTCNSILPAEEDEINLADTKIYNLLLGKLYPEKQALSNEELVHLLESDKLNIAKELGDLELQKEA